MTRLYQGSRKNRIITPGASPVFETGPPPSGGFTPVSKDVEGGTIGQPLTTGTDFVKHFWRTDPPLIAAPYTGQGRRFTDYDQSIKIETSDVAGEGWAVDVGILPADFKVEFGQVSHTGDQTYMWNAIMNVNAAGGHGGLWNGTDSDKDQMRINTMENEVAKDLDELAQTNQLFIKPTKTRFSYDSATRLLTVVSIMDQGLTWTNTLTVHGDVTMNALRWLGGWGGVNNSYFADWYLVYVWAGNLTDDWPIRTIGAV